MRILSCCPREYWHLPGTVSSDYVYFVETLRGMGHTVHHFDYVSASYDREMMNDFFLSIIKRGGYDLVWVVTNHDEFIPDVLDEVKRLSVLVAWNSDDNIRWDDYSLIWAPHFTYMVTTYRHIYNDNRVGYPNLLLSQWGCTGNYDGLKVKKDIDLSFVGNLYKKRFEEIRYIRKRQKITVFGMDPAVDFKSRVLKWLLKPLGFSDWSPKGSKVLADEAAIKGIWNRSRVSFTPLNAWVINYLQIKARIFDMGLSGTVMLCNSNPDLHEFYEPDKEYVEYTDMEECISKVKFLLSHESERRQISLAYYKRTKREHMWHDRFNLLFSQIGLPKNK